MCGGRFFIGAEASLQPVTAGVLLVLIGMTQSGRFVGTVAVAAFAGVNGIAAAGAGSRNHGRHTVMGMAFLGYDGDRFCFGVAAITVVGQNAFVRFCGLRCDLCTAEHMGFHIDFGCAAISAPVPMLVIIIVLFSQCGGAVSARRAVMRLPLVAFHADAVAAAIAAAHVRAADHAQLAAVAERLALLADAAGRTGLGAVPAEGSTVRAQRCTVAAVMAVVTHSVVVPGTLRAGPAVGAEVLHAVLAPGAVRAHDRTVCTVLLAVRADVLAVFAGAAALTVLAAVLAFPALGAELAAYAVPADIAVGAHVCAVPADLSAFLADHRAVTARSAVMAELIHALVTAAAVRAEILRAIRTGQTLRAEVDALIADRHALGAKGNTVLARAARFAVSAIAAEAVGAMVDVGADPIHAVAAQLTVAAPFACAVQTRIAALLANQGTLGAHAAAGTVSVGAVGADPTVRADIIPAFSAMFTAFRADLRTIRAAFVADADGHAVAAVVAVAAPAIASRAVLAAVTITAHFLAAFLTLLAAGQTDIAAAGAGLSAVADELRAVFTHAAALTGRARAGGAHTALRAELVPAVAAVLGAVRTDIRALGAAIAFEAGDLTVTADVAVAAPAVAVRAVLAASAFFAELIPTDATALGT